MTIIASFAPGPEGEAALAAAARLAQSSDESMLVVVTIPTDEAMSAAREAAAQYGDVECVSVREGEDIVEVILEYVEERQASNLVIGLRRRSAVGKLVLGSSAQRLLLDAPCPVLCVKRNLTMGN